MVIPQLPHEVLELVLLQLATQHIETDSVRTLCNVGLACSRFLLVSRSSSVWRLHYIVRWYRCDKTREYLRQNTAQGDWYKMYTMRSRIDSRAKILLDTIVCQPHIREVAATELVQSMGYDIWDSMSLMAERVRVPEVFETTESSDVDQIKNLLPKNGLTRKYWARQVLEMIARVRALNIWLPLTNFFEAEVSFEHALAALSAFFGEDVERIFEEFDRLAEECRSYISASKAESLPDILIQICIWMRQKGFMKTDLVNYHNLMNHFPHRVLFENHLTLPMSLSYVFVCISRRLGLNAHPVAFPRKVIAIVIPPEGESIYVDIFESATRPILMYSDLVSMLESIGINPAAPSSVQYSIPAPTGTMLLRAVGNIIQSLDRITWSDTEGQRPAHYAAHCAALLLTGDPRLVQLLFVIGTGGPLDGEIVLRQTLRSGLPEATKEELDLYLTRQAELEKSYPKDVDELQKAPYFVGMVFTHKRYSYVGLIKDWNTHCAATEDWIRHMRVDELIRGRSQPFYYCLTVDGHVRYVAEENIQPLIHPTVRQLCSLIKANENIGRWFDGVEVSPSGAVRFKLSVEAQMLHPNDDALCGDFLADISQASVDFFGRFESVL